MKCARVAAAASVVGLYEDVNKMSGDLIYLNTGSSGIVHPEPQILLVCMIFSKKYFLLFVPGPLQLLGLEHYYPTQSRSIQELFFF